MGGKGAVGNTWDNLGNPNALFNANTGKGDNSVYQKLLDPGGFVWDQSGDLPVAPDFYDAAHRQGMSTRPDQATPFASSAWSYDPVSGKYSQNVSLAGGMNDAVTALGNQIGANAGKPLPTGQEARDQAISSYYAQAMSRLRPEWDQRENQMRSRLASQGLDPTTEAATSQTDAFGRARNDAEATAMSSAIQHGTEAGNAIFQQGMQSAQLPYQQMSALKSLTGGLASGTEADPYAAAAAAKYMGDVEGYSAKQAGKNSKTAGAASMAGGIASMFSDERLKANVERLPIDVLPGVPFASWEWKDAPGTREYGVIAQDLQKVRPDLVHEDPASGFLKVDYSFLSGE